LRRLAVGEPDKVHRHHYVAEGAGERCDGAQELALFHRRLGLG
jgi:hypothetical protein